MKHHYIRALCAHLESVSLSLKRNPSMGTRFLCMCLTNNTLLIQKKLTAFLSPSSFHFFSSFLVKDWRQNIKKQLNKKLTQNSAKPTTQHIKIPNSTVYRKIGLPTAVWKTTPYFPLRYLEQNKTINTMSCPFLFLFFFLNQWLLTDISAGVGLFEIKSLINNSASFAVRLNTSQISSWDEANQSANDIFLLCSKWLESFFWKKAMKKAWLNRNLFAFSEWYWWWVDSWTRWS